MQPYQEADAATRKSGELPLNAAKYAAGAAVGTAGSMAARGIISRMIPLLSPLIPKSFAKKGMEKVDPRLGKFITKAEDEGFDFDEITNFLHEKIKTSEEMAPAKEDRNIIQQYSPNLFQYIQELIQNGSTPTEAAMKAQKNLDNKYKSMIKQIENDHKTPWSAIVESIFGQAGTQQQQPSENSGQMGQNGQMGQQGGPGQQALMAILGKINQKLGQ